MVITVSLLLAVCTVNASLIAYWPFDFGSAHDCCGNNHGTIGGDPTWTDGYSGGALEFDGIDDHVDCGDNQIFDLTQEITISAWVYIPISDGPDRTIIGKGDSAWRLRIFRGKKGVIHFAVTGEDPFQYVDGDTGIASGRWNHVCSTFDEEKQRIYIDGEIDVARPYTGPISVDQRRVWIGANSHRGYYFKGKIDEVAIFNHALKPNEVRRLYQEGVASFRPETHMIQLVKRIKASIPNLAPRETITFIEEEISEYERWKANNLPAIKPQDKTLAPELYYILAQAKEKAGIHRRNVVDAYKRVVWRVRYPDPCVPAALLWLSQNLPEDEYLSTVKNFVYSCDIPVYCVNRIANHFQSKGTWATFMLFLEGVFSVNSEISDICACAQGIAMSLAGNEEWTSRFQEYCRNQSKLTEYVFRSEEASAAKYMNQKNYQKAFQVYQEIMNRCGPNQIGITYEYKVCHCLFNMQDYDKAFQASQRFIEKNRNKCSTPLLAKALMLKGQSLVNMGKTERAVSTFFDLLVTCPDTDAASKAGFLVGYFQMLQGKYSEAVEAFNIVTADYPRTEHAKKSQVLITRIQKMTE